MQKKTPSANKPPIAAPAKAVSAKPVVRPPNDDDDEIVLTPVSDIKYNRSWLFYGRAGTGKTTVAGSFPGDVLLIDVQDEGTDSVKDVPGLTVIQCRTFNRLDRIYWDIRDKPEKYARFKTIVIDTITQLQTLCIREFMDSKGNTKAAGGWGSMKQRDWGTVSSMMKDAITDWRNLPFNTVFLAQDREDKPHGNDDEDEINSAVTIVKDDNGPPPLVLDDDDQDGIMPSIGPSLSPATAKHLCAAVHVIGYTFIKDVGVQDKPDDKLRRNTQYHMRIGPHPIFSTKMRKPKLLSVPKTLLDPTYEKLLAVLDGIK